MSDFLEANKGVHLAVDIDIGADESCPNILGVKPEGVLGLLTTCLARSCENLAHQPIGQRDRPEPDLGEHRQLGDGRLSAERRALYHRVSVLRLYILGAPCHTQSKLLHSPLEERAAEI